MYERGCAAAVGACTAALPLTGANVAWLVVAGVTVLLAGIALVRLMPRRRSA